MTSVWLWAIATHTKGLCTTYYSINMIGEYPFGRERLAIRTLGRHSIRCIYPIQVRRFPNRSPTHILSAKQTCSTSRRQLNQGQCHEIVNLHTRTRIVRPTFRITGDSNADCDFGVAP